MLLCIVMCDVIRSSPLIFGRRRKFTEREVHATVCYPEGLGDWTRAVDVELWRPDTISIRILRNPVNPWEFVTLAVLSESETRLRNCNCRRVGIVVFYVCCYFVCYFIVII